jgi:TatD DNase family protein
MVGIIDTHSHLYAEQLQPVEDVIVRLQEKGVVKVLLPNIDLESIQPMKELVAAYPELCIPMMGLHPCSVKEDYKLVLDTIHQELEKGEYCAVGEMGIDLYWDKSTKDNQIDAFHTQCNWALEKNLPIVIHARDALEVILNELENRNDNNLQGVFHCFTGNDEDANRVQNLDFYIGIGGVLTFKNSSLREVLKSIPLDRVLLETDAPYLAPVPFRGKTNEPSYLTYIVQELAKVYQCSENEIIRTTYNNALNLFKI